jgi:hypothetical protein
MHEGVRGDRNETFAFATLFPDRVQCVTPCPRACGCAQGPHKADGRRPMVRVVSTATFRLLVLLRLCTRVERTPLEMEESQLTNMQATASPLGSDGPDAERRRCVAHQPGARACTSCVGLGQAKSPGRPQQPAGRRRGGHRRINSSGHRSSGCGTRASASGRKRCAGGNGGMRLIFVRSGWQCFVAGQRPIHHKNRAHQAWGRVLADGRGTTVRSASPLLTC